MSGMFRETRTAVETASKNALLKKLSADVILVLQPGMNYKTENIMNNIGKRIKELRKKNDLTQEKLADFLGVTYQAVSKWETGIASPDLSLIAPLTRLLRCTADELLGLSAPETDERKAYFDRECFEYWKKDDHDADYLIAKQAVEEYPDNFAYLNWLAAVEYYTAFDDGYRSGGSLDHFNERIESSLKHYFMVYENCPDENRRNTALWGIILDYKYSWRPEEAKKYAMLYPEYDGATRADALELCLEGEELLAHQQEMISDALAKLCGKLGNMWTFANPADPRTIAAVKAEKAVIEAIIPDGNYLQFNTYLLGIHEELAAAATLEGDFDTAISELREAKKFAAESDRARTSGKQYYTCPILDHFDYDYSDCRPFETSEVGYLIERLNEYKIYAPLRDRDDFKKLTAE